MNGPADVPEAERPLVVAVCTARVEDLRARWEHNIEQRCGAEYLVVVDHPDNPEILALAERIRARGGTVLLHGATRGLSAARNTVLDHRPDHCVLFIDDDLILSREAVLAVRTAFADGAQVTGARLVPPGPVSDLPWYLTRGQMHLVGWHATEDSVKVWGAFMGIDARFAREHGLRFDHRLGRTGRRLESGDDTSFVTAMKRCGAKETLLPSIQVVHEVDARRLDLRYLLRRSYWQGRSEVRRRQPLTGVRKEWRRHRRLSPPSHALPLAAGYVAVFLVGVGLEAVLSLFDRDRPDAATPG
jgi:glycosyltransferase involved in cell wall biosynthesis